MPKRRKKTVPIPKTKVTTDRLKVALAKCKKTELVDVIVEMAKANRAIQRQLESQFEVEAPPEELIAATRVAIADATDFDEREINYNFAILNWLLWPRRRNADLDERTPRDKTKAKTDGCRKEGKARAKKRNT